MYMHTHTLNATPNWIDLQLYLGKGECLTSHHLGYKLISILNIYIQIIIFLFIMIITNSSFSKTCPIYS